MSTPTVIHSPNGDAVFIDDVYGVQTGIANGQKYIGTADAFRFFGRFQTFVFEVATTNEVLVLPLPGGSIFLTDLIVNARAQTNREITISLTDGTQTETLFDANLNSDAVRFSASFSGRWRGWEDARIEVTCSATNRYSIGVGYVKTRSSEKYAAWDAAR